MLAISMLCLGGSVFTITQGSAQNDWSTASGTITQARIAPPSTPGKREQRHFVYEYEVDGKTYSSDRFSFASVGGDRTAGIQRYRPGDPVVVHYNPKQPSIAVLEKEQPGLFVYVVFMLGILSLMGSLGSLLANDATTLFTPSGVAGVWAGVWKSRSRNAEPEAEQDAPRDKSLRKVEETLRSQLETGMMNIERAAELLQYATELDRETCRSLARELAAGRDIALSSQMINERSARR